ncbi:MAG: hypothetical protein M3R39_06460 [Actinomycetota bacterium]|nr:hypothetical protein [Actinomycetota bacterium]
MPADYKVIRLHLGSYLTGYIAGPTDQPDDERAIALELSNLAQEGWELASTELLAKAPDGTENQLLLFLAKA